MIYVIDTEFIDTPLTSELISLAVINERMDTRYFEFDFDEKALTPWLHENVVPHLSGKRTTFYDAAQELREFVEAREAEFWAYYGAYDWYWMCRLFGGMMSLPEGWPMGYNDLACYTEGIPNTAGPEHHAENDAVSAMTCFKRLRRMGVVRQGMHRPL